MRALATFSLLLLCGCPSASTDIPVDEQDVIGGDDTEHDAAASAPQACIGPDDVAYAWGSRGDRLVLLAPNGDERVVFEGPVDTRGWTFLQAGNYVAGVARWRRDAETYGAWAGIADEDGTLLAQTELPGASGWSSFLSPDGELLLRAGSGPGGTSWSQVLRADGSRVHLPFGRPAGPAQDGVYPLCRNDFARCGWMGPHDDALFGAMDDTPFVRVGERMARLNRRAFEVQIDHPWDPELLDVRAFIGEEDPYARILSSAPNGSLVIGGLGDWDQGRWVVVDAPRRDVRALDLNARGELVTSGHCDPSPPALHGDGLVFAVRDEVSGRFVRRDLETGVEEAMGASVSHFLFAQSAQRDGTWALSTSDGSDSFCRTSEPAWSDDPEADGNTLQLLRPEDEIEHFVEVGPISFNFVNRVSIASGGWCAAIPAGPEWDAPVERFDIGTGGRFPFPEGFAFGGWLDRLLTAP